MSNFYFYSHRAQPGIVFQVVLAISTSVLFRDRAEEKLLPSKPTAAPEPDPDNMTDASWQLATHSYC